MSVGIVRYPGSNCDYDTLRYFEKDNSFFIWHKDTIFPANIKLLVIPGGFAFGDRVYSAATDKYTISPGTMALESPVSSIIKEAVKRNIPILGICNGFQILTQMGLLPGNLQLNDNKKFTCKKVKCNILDSYTTDFYIANSYGKYVISEAAYAVMKDNGQILVTYKDSASVSEVGSMYNIAGVCNRERTIFGMMPHPERNNDDFKDMLDGLIFSTVLSPTHLKFKRKISELMNSEHISYKSTRKYLKKLPTQSNFVIQGPGENAGIVDIGDGYCIALRIESHNHPTFINPFEGAATGVGGILRDIFTMGAKPIAILDFLRFGTDQNSKRLLDKSVEGISYYGNCIGVPNIGGDCRFHNSYNKNPLINVGCIGIVKKDNIIYGRATGEDQLLIYVGSKTGNEGIGGAAMASNSFRADVNINDLKKNVQKADPFLEKLLLDACCEIAEHKLVVGMQDMGAGGILCASLEVLLRGNEYRLKKGMSNKSKLGCSINIDAVPIKDEMEPCDILISESQERMFIVATEPNKDKIFEIFKKWDLEYAVIGTTNFSGIYSICNNDNEVLYTAPLDSFTDIEEHWAINDLPPKIKIDLPSNKGTLKSLWKQYDSTVGNRTLKGPDLPGRYSLLDIYEVGKKLAVTWGEEISTCVQQLGALGAIPLCAVNCLNYGHPQESMSDFSDNIDKMVQQCKTHHVPIVGGNVSMYNSTDGAPIRPTPIIMMIGII
ncbi:MAG: hypothetical protein CMM25_07185 [Rhodospirillaceae bacterium]|nr:hypothetical protein [Rhodospirillaceae bacterium]